MFMSQSLPSILSPELFLSLRHFFFFSIGLSSLPGYKAIHPCFLPVLECFHFLHSNVAHFERGKVSDKPEKSCVARKSGKDKWWRHVERTWKSWRGSYGPNLGQYEEQITESQGICPQRHPSGVRCWDTVRATSHVLRRNPTVAQADQNLGRLQRAREQAGPFSLRHGMDAGWHRKVWPCVQLVTLTELTARSWHNWAASASSKDLCGTSESTS